MPLDWARAQNNLGLVLQTLGVRESDTVRLEAAVEAYRAALKERTRERVPLQWAVTQYNLGMVLTELGKLQRDKSRLAEAKQAIQQAQGIFRDTSMTQYEDSFKEELEKIDNLLEAIANNKP